MDKNTLPQSKEQKPIQTTIEEGTTEPTDVGPSPKETGSQPIPKQGESVPSVKISRLQIVKEKVAAMIKSSPKITLDSLKIQSIKELKDYIDIIDRPQVITHFSKNNSKLGDEMMHTLGLNKFCNIEFLSLENAKLSAEGFKYLMGLDLRNLKQLYLAKNNIGDCEVEETGLPALTLLSLSGNKITAAGVKGMRKLYGNLESLSFRLNDIGKAGLQELVQQRMPKLTYLHLQSCNLSPESMEVLSQTKDIELVFPALTSLYLNYNILGRQGLEHLLRSPILSHIENLGLEGSISGVDTLPFKKYQEGIQALTCLNLTSNNLTDALVKGLASTCLPLIALINLKSNNLTVQSLRLFSESDLPQLFHLSVQNNPNISGNSSSIRGLEVAFKSVRKGNNNKVYFNL